MNRTNQHNPDAGQDPHVDVTTVEGPAKDGSTRTRLTVDEIRFVTVRSNCEVRFVNLTASSQLL